MLNKKIELQEKIKSLMIEWSDLKDSDYLGQDKVQYSGPKFGPSEYAHMLDAIFDGWWSGGKYGLEAEDKLARVSDRKHGLVCNSGSSANLLLMSAAKKLYFNDGDHILTLACGFPTTLNPIIQNNLIPVFIDIDLYNLNADSRRLELAIKADKKIKGVFIPHTLGFCSDVQKIVDICRNNNVKIFFDCCDAYGSVYLDKPLSSYGDAATLSFYVAHHISCGEGGGIVTDNDELHATMRSFRNWGRYCSAPQCCIRSKNPNLFCPARKLTENCLLPQDYHVNYQFEFVGYNLKMLELQAAILSKQIDRLEEFNNIRKRNYWLLLHHLEDLLRHSSCVVWKLPDGVSPFAFPILLPANNDRIRFVDHMTRNNIETRMLFAGNLTKHPAYRNSEFYKYREFFTSDVIMERFIMVGVSAINNDEKTMKIVSAIKSFFEENK